MSQVPRMLLLIELFVEHRTLVPLPLLSKISTRRPSHPAIVHEGKWKCEQRTHITRTFQVQTPESVRSRLRHNGVDQSISGVLVSQFELCGTQITDAQPPTMFVGRAQFRISGAQCRGRGLRGIGRQVSEIGQLERIAIGEFHTILRSEVAMGINIGQLLPITPSVISADTGKTKRSPRCKTHIPHFGIPIWPAPMDVSREFQLPFL